MHRSILMVHKCTLHNGDARSRIHSASWRIPFHEAEWMRLSGQYLQMLFRPQR